jgi:hypothetical protein
MKWIAPVSLLAVASALVVAARAGDHDVARAVLAGMLGPAIISGGSWAQAARIQRADPARLTSYLMTSFMVKVVLFGAYVALALRVLLVPGYPFAVSFAIYFVMFYASEALWLARLARQTPGARS